VLKVARAWEICVFSHITPLLAYRSPRIRLIGWNHKVFSIARARAQRINLGSSPSKRLFSRPSLLPQRLEHDELRTNHHRALAFCLRMIFSENRYTLFRIMR
jgi:hypothetical protein